MPPAENAESVDETIVEGQEVDEEVIEGEVDEPSDDETQETEDEEVEIVLEGEEEPAPQKDKIPRRARKLLERNARLESELETTQQSNNAEIERLKTELANSLGSQQQAVTTAMPMPPTEAEHGYDPEKLAEAQTQYRSNFANWLKGQQTSQADTASQTEAQDQRAIVEAEKLEDHYKRADNLKVKDYDANEEAAAKVLGKKLVKSIAIVMPNSAMIINYLGVNPRKAQEIADLNKTDPNKGVAKLWELNFGLKAKSRKRSNAPEPEQRVEGGGGGATSALQKQYDKATENANIKERRRLRAIAKEKGIKLED